ncbi:MAG TPA: hypothetical protein PKD45_12900 [Flavobacteriales bacterium]|nr:hypothetical protein [Flavobacteriales bacterium]
MPQPFFRYLLILALVATGMGCKKDNASPSGGGGGGGGTPPTGTAMVQFTINGDGFSNQVITINPIPSSGQATYSTDDDETSGVCVSADGKLFSILFDGNTTGTQQYDANMSTQVGFSMTLAGGSYLSYSGTVVIEEYGAVGGWVRGSFDGTVIRLGSSGTYATISNSSFRFKRVADN